MRFSNVLVALGGVAGVVSAFQDVDDRHSLEVVENNGVDRASTIVVNHPGLDARGGTKKTTTSKVAKTTTSQKATGPTTSSTHLHLDVPSVSSSTQVVVTQTSTSKTLASTSTTSSSTSKTSTSTTSSNQASSTKDAACSLKRSPRPRYMRRTLERKIAAKTADGFVLYENEWVTPPTIKKGDKVAVVDVSGCSAVFFWNSDNVPAVFHIFCGNEDTDGKAAAEIVAEFFEPVAVTIAAESDKSSKEIQKAIKKVFDYRGKDDAIEFLEGEKYNYGNDARASDERFRFDATAGTRLIVKSKESLSSCSRQLG